MAKTISATDEKRLWIGNLDPRITEYHLLKLTQKYGTIEKFDLLFHKTGALAGQPRGYAFVTYSSPEEAMRAKAMHNMLLGSRNIIVTWAHSVTTDMYDEPKKSDVNIPALALAKTDKSQPSRECQIQAIEAKLKMMESQSSKGLEINKSVAQERSVIAVYQQNKQQQGVKPMSSTKPKRYEHHKPNRKPYDKYKRR